jgi:hypothetical protein
MVGPHCIMLVHEVILELYAYWWIEKPKWMLEVKWGILRLVSLSELHFICKKERANQLS